MTDLVSDPDYIATTVATQRAIEGCSGAVARELGMLGETAGRRIRSLGNIEEPERVTLAYKFLRFLQACEQHNPDREKALAPLYSVMELMRVGDSADGPGPARSFLLDMTEMHGDFGSFLIAIDEAIEDDQVSPIEAADLAATARTHIRAVRHTLARLETAARRKERLR